MDPLDLYLTVQADLEGRAQRRREVRHVHLEPAPLAIALVQMASEPFAIWGALVGTSRDEPKLILAPEPRNADIAFLAMAEFAKVLCGVVDEAMDGPHEVRTAKAGHQYTISENAPQLLVTNPAAVNLLKRLGRRMRTAGYGGHVTVPKRVNTAGAHLDLFAESAERPGSSLVIPATEALSHHWVTGQSALEDDHLGAQLAWHDPSLIEKIDPKLVEGVDPSELSGAQAANLAETIPMGVLTDPDDDNSELLDAVIEFNRRRAGKTDARTVKRLGKRVGELLRERALDAMWSALWLAYDRLADLPAGERVASRWEDDRYNFTRDVKYTRRGGHRAVVDSPRRAAMLLADWEGRQSAFDTDEFLDDRLARVGELVAGRAVKGRVAKVDRERFDLNAAGEPTLQRPRITLEVDGEVGLPIGYELWWSERPAQTGAEVDKVTVRGKKSRVVLKVTAGVTGKLPRVGSRVVFSQFSEEWRSSLSLPDDLPWTHVASEDGEASEDLDESQSLDEVLAAGGSG